MVEARTNCKLYWSIDNNADLIEFLKTQSKNFRNIKIFSGDFSSLFTNLPHDVVLDCIYGLIDKCFNNTRKDYLEIEPSGKIKYQSESQPDKLIFHVDHVKELVQYILDESYVKFGDKIFKQVNGIPQGGNASPLIADLTLTWMEYCFINKNKKIFNKNNFNAFRYMDDVIQFYEEGALDIANINKCIYHSSLELNNTVMNNIVQFLDLEITNETKNVTYKLYNKTDDYSFNIVRYPHRLSNIPCFVKNNTFTTELSRIMNCCSHKIDIETRILQLCKKFVENSFSRIEVSNLLKSSLNKLANKNYDISGINCDNILF